MQGFSIRDMLRKANSNPEAGIDRLPAQLASILERYRNDRDILPAFRSDIYRFLSASVNLVEAMADKTFVSQTVITHAYDIFTACSNFMLQAERTRVTKPCFGIQHSVSKAILPQIFATEGEAHAYIDDHAPFGNIAQMVEVIPIEIVSRYGRQPSRVASGQSLPQPIQEVDDAHFTDLPDEDTPTITIPPRVPEPPTAAALENAEKARKAEIQAALDVAEKVHQLPSQEPETQQQSSIPTPSFRRE